MPADRATVDCPLGRDWDKVSFTAGLGDESEEGARGLLEVYADKKLIFKQTMDKGEHQTVERSLKSTSGRRALTLRLVVTMLADSDGHCARPGRAAFGDAVLTQQLS